MSGTRPMSDSHRWGLRHPRSRPAPPSTMRCLRSGSLPEMSSRSSPATLRGSPRDANCRARRGTPPRPWRGALAMLRGVGEVIHRGLLVVLGLGVVTLCGPPLAMGQPEAKIIRIGAVSAGAPRTSPHWVAFAQRLGELGYVEGRNVVIEFRSAEGKPERFPE